MRRSIAAIVVVVLGASSARAGDCVVNENPVSPATLAYELELGSGSIPGQLAGVPFSVVNYQQVSITWTGCAQDCLYLTYPGDTQCGNLVETPVESTVSAEVVGVPDPNAFSDVFAGQVDGGRWNVFAQALVNPSWDETGKSAAYVFDLGTREVIDVGGSAGSVDIRLRAGSDLGVQRCFADIFEWIPRHDLRFRVTERTTFTTLVPTTYWDQFFEADETFTIDVQPGWVLQVDVYFDVFANATSAQEQGGEYCDGAIAILDFLNPPAGDGIQLFFDADPGTTLTPRSGIVYETPEPEGGAFAAFASALLLAASRRRR
jgi:hypothetical protein